MASASPVSATAASVRREFVESGDEKDHQQNQRQDNGARWKFLGNPLFRPCGGEGDGYKHDDHNDHACANVFFLNMGHFVTDYSIHLALVQVLQEIIRKEYVVRHVREGIRHALALRGKYVQLIQLGTGLLCDGEGAVTKFAGGYRLKFHTESFGKFLAHKPPAEDCGCDQQDTNPRRGEYLGNSEQEQR